MPSEARIGDRIILCRADGKFDLYKVDAESDRVLVRESLAALQIAYEIARGSLPSGGQVWVCAEATPDVLKPY
jgi:hypothetical protein